MSDDTPPSVTDAVGNAGTLPAITWKGKPYSVAHATPKAVQRVEQEVAAQAWANVLALRGMPGWDELRADTLKAIQAKHWAFAAPLYTAAMDGPDGWPLMLWGCLTERHPELRLADVRDMFRDCPDDVDFALAAVGGGFFSSAAGLMTAPEADRAMLAAALTAALLEWLAKKAAAKGGRPG